MRIGRGNRKILARGISSLILASLMLMGSLPLVAVLPVVADTTPSGVEVEVTHVWDSPTAMNFGLMEFNGEMYVGGMWSGAVYRSTNKGADWERCYQSTGTVTWGSCVLNGQLYLTNENVGKIFRTSDGENWNDVLTTSAVDGFKSTTVYDGKVYFGSLKPSKVFASDGLTAFTEVFSEPYTGVYDMLATKDALFIAVKSGSSQTRFYKTTDGTSWTYLSTVDRKEPDGGCMVEFGNTFYYASKDGDVFRTEDFIEFEQVFDGNQCYGMGTYHGYIVLGQNLNNADKDGDAAVFISPDGDNWEQAYDSPEMKSCSFGYYSVDDCLYFSGGSHWNGAHGSIYKMYIEPRNIPRVDYAIDMIEVEADDPPLIVNGTATIQVNLTTPLGPPGSGLTRLTKNDAAKEEMPTCSPVDGRIAFRSNASGHREIWTMDLDGTNQRQVTDIYSDLGATSYLGQSWTPDGQTLIFTPGIAPSFDVYSVDADGSNLTFITDANTRDKNPCVSADGDHIYFATDPNWIPSGYVVRIDRDGGNANIMDANDGKGNAWLSIGGDGSFLLMNVDEGPSGYSGPNNIYKLFTDGSPKEPVFARTGDQSYGMGHQSPDGTKLAFRFRESSSEDFDICVADIDGTNMTRITTDDADDRSPWWTPDGNGIVFVSDRGGSQDIWMYRFPVEYNMTTWLSVYDGDPDDNGSLIWEGNVTSWNDGTASIEMDWVPTTNGTHSIHAILKVKNALDIDLTNNVKVLDVEVVVPTLDVSIHSFEIGGYEPPLTVDNITMVSLLLTVSDGLPIVHLQVHDGDPKEDGVLIWSSTISEWTDGRAAIEFEWVPKTVGTHQLHADIIVREFLDLNDTNDHRILDVEVAGPPMDVALTFLSVERSNMTIGETTNITVGFRVPEGGPSIEVLVYDGNRSLGGVLLMNETYLDMSSGDVRLSLEWQPEFVRTFEIFAIIEVLDFVDPDLSNNIMTFYVEVGEAPIPPIIREFLAIDIPESIQLGETMQIGLLVSFEPGEDLYIVIQLFDPLWTPVPTTINSYSMDVSSTRWFFPEVEIPMTGASGKYIVQVSLLERLPEDGGWCIHSINKEVDVS